MATFQTAETTVDSPASPCLLIFGGTTRDAATRQRLLDAARRQQPGAHVVLLWDSPDGRTLQFDGPFELTPWFSRLTPEKLRALINGQIEA
jgi:hypothetical protein